MSRNPRPVEAFQSVLRAISLAGEPIILVGGHAVNVWALAYRDRIAPQLEPLLPLTSGDIDLFSTRQGLINLHRELGGRLLLSGPRETTEGTLVLGVEPDTLEVDVLRSLYGVPHLTAQDTVTLQVCGHAIPVPFPHLLLQGKLANALQLDQRGRQDVKHVRIAALVLEEFLREVVATASVVNEKPALGLFRAALGILTSPEAQRFSAQYDFPFHDVMPGTALVASPLVRLRELRIEGTASPAAAASCQRRVS